MQENKIFKLIFKSTTFPLPSNFRFLNDISPSISSILLTQKSYEIKSEISEEVFKSFIDFLVNRKVPEISPNNINEFDIISQEFDYMKDLVQLSKNKINFITKLRNQNKNLKKIHGKIMDKIDQKVNKYQQIIHYFIKDNKIDSYKNYLEKRGIMHELCKSYSVNEISLFTQKTINYDGNFILVLNDEKKTAGILRIISSDNTIPRSIEYQKQEYLIDSIYENAFYHININSPLHIAKNSELKFIGKNAFSQSTIKNILIPPKVERIEDNAFSSCKKLERIEFHLDSKLKSIGKNAFSNTLIKSLIIPSCVLEFNDGWCKNTPNLINIIIIPSDEQNIIYYDNNFIIGKSDPKSDIFDVLYFARRNIKEAIIPPFIKIIESFAFEKCNSLQKVEFAGDSQLIKIGQMAFSCTSLKSLTIPSSIVEFQSGWCFNNRDLTDFKIIQNKVQNIIYYDNKFIIGKSDQNNNIFDTIFFARRDIEIVNIPSNIKYIRSFAFENCRFIKKMDFGIDSELISIGQHAFSQSSISNVLIPPSVYKIGKFSFSSCNKLQSFEISNKNEMIKICGYAFYNSFLKSLAIPSKGIIFENEWCFGISQLNDIKIHPNKKQDIIYYDNKFIVGKKDQKCEDLNTIIFVSRKYDETITIPPFIKYISNYAFEFINNVQFADNSIMQEFCSFSFSNSYLNKITIPPSVTKIEQNSFSNIRACIIVEFAENSQLNLIGMNCFSKSLLTSIKIPSSVTKIDKFAFYDCIHLTKVEFDKNSKLCSIEEAVFSNTSLYEITIPSNVTRIEKYAFYRCANLQKVEFSPDSKLKLINECAFRSTGLVSIKIPPSVLYIESFAFAECENLVDVKMLKNSSLKIIGSFAFNCTLISSIIIPSQVVLIDCCAFKGCQSLQNIIISEDSQLNCIGHEAFSINGINYFFIPKHVTQIGNYAFANCDNLKEVECAEDSELKSIGGFIFSESPLKKISLPSCVSEFNDDWGILLSRLSQVKIIPTKERNIIKYQDYILSKSDPKSDIYDVIVFANREIEYVIIPSFIKRIAASAFAYCKWIESITFTDDSQLLYIDKKAFTSSSVENIVFPSHLVSVGEDSFIECESLNNVDFSKAMNLKTIGRHAFSNSSLESISFPSNVVLNNELFSMSTNLTSIEIIPNEQQNISLYNNCFLIAKSDTKNDNFDVLVFIRQNIVNATVPSFIKTICELAFCNCPKLKSLNFEKNSELNIICEGAFFMSNLEKFYIPNKVTKIEEMAFSSCKKLNKVNFEENSSLKIIEDFVFNDTALTCFSIPKNVMKIGRFAFSSCKKLQIIEINAESQLLSLNSDIIDIPNVIFMVPSELNGKLILNA